MESKQLVSNGRFSLIFDELEKYSQLDPEMSTTVQESGLIQEFSDICHEMARIENPVCFTTFA